MNLNSCNLQLLSIASRLPVLGFYQSLLVRFNSYLRAHDAPVEALIVNRKIPFARHIHSRMLSELNGLVKGNYLKQVTTGIADESISSRSFLKVTDKGWRLAGGDEQYRINYLPSSSRVVSTPHDLLVSAVLLTFHFERHFQLSRPVKWRRTASAVDCPLPDGVIESPFGEMWAVEIERHVNRKHLEGHIIYHGKGSRVLLIFEKLTRPILKFTLDLFRKYQLKNWYFTSCKAFFADGGKGPWINLQDRGFIIGENGEMMSEETCLTLAKNYSTSPLPLLPALPLVEVSPDPCLSTLPGTSGIAVPLTCGGVLLPAAPLPGAAGPGISFDGSPAL